MSTEDMAALLRDIQRRCEKVLSVQDKTMHDKELYRQALVVIALDAAPALIHR